jgi:IS30 family transposase
MATAKHPGGRKRIRIDPKRVEQFAVMGCSAAEIAAELGVAPRTISDRFSSILKNGKKRMELRLRSKLVQEAMKGNTAILIFAGKTLLGLKEPLTEQHAINLAVVQNNHAKVVTAEVRKQFLAIDEAIRKEAAQLELENVRSVNGNGDS